MGPFLRLAAIWVLAGALVADAASIGLVCRISLRESAAFRAAKGDTRQQPQPGRNSTAQGASPGIRRSRAREPQRGEIPLCVGLIAFAGVSPLQGSADICTAYPGLAPWAIEFRPFGADATHSAQAAANGTADCSYRDDSHGTSQFACGDNRNEGKPPARRRVVIAFSSLRERPAFSNVYFYRHDGVGQGELAGPVPAQFERADSHPSLTADGARCAYASKQIGGFTPLVNLWNPRENRIEPAPGFNAETGSRIEPALSGDGRWLAVCARGHSTATGGWDVVLFEMATGKEVPLPGLNSDHDEREVAVDRAGRYLAFVTNRRGGAGLSDLALYDRQSAALVPLDGLNTDHREINPALSADGRFLAFVSDRPGGAGGKDIYIFDQTERRLVDLPGLNSVGHEQTPAFSPDGRFIAFVSERTSGSGERDIYLYDRDTSRLIPTPGLNSKQEDFDPALAFEELEPKE